MEPIDDMVAQGEGEMLEFKPSFNQDVVETASAFANSRGGRVLVGVSNAGEPLGLSFGEEMEELLRPNHSSKPRNRLVAQAFYDMGMIEQYGSGIERVQAACAEAGLPVPEFENFSGGFQVVFKPLGTTAAQVGEQVGEQVVLALETLAKGEKTKAELLAALGFSSVYLNYKRHIIPLIESGLIEMTIPEKPTSRLQKYRLTEKGKQLLNNEQ